MTIREREWSKRLAHVSLAAEALDAVHTDHRDQALAVLGGLVRKQPDAYHRSRILRRWPAVHIIATTGVAVDHFASNTFWPRLHESLGVRADNSFSREWGEAFLANLTRLDLPTFAAQDSDAGTKYVGRILMHSGMPTFCLPDFFELVSERRRRVPGLASDAFASWAAARAELRQLTSVDMPVSRFLQYGGDFARDVVSRTFELLDVVTSGGDPADVPLPDRFRRVAIDMWGRGRISPAAAGADGPAGESDSQPKLILEPFGRGLLLRLPPVGEAPDGRASWIVNIDGVSQTIATRALFPGIDDIAPTTDVAIPHPARAVAVALAGREHLQIAMPIVDDRFPLLAFGEDGAALPGFSPLRARPTWLLFPGDPGALQVVGDVTIQTESPLPPGWAGWSLVLADLAKVAEVRLADFALARGVRTDTSARIVAGDPVPGFTTSAGQPVFARLPSIVLPEGMEEARWEVTLQGEDRNVLSRWSSESAESLDSVWADAPTDLVGTFIVRVRGPWGRGATRRMPIVSGLAVDFSPEWRRFMPEGLQPSTAVVRVGPGVELSRSSLEFGSSSRETHVRVGARGAFATLAVTPPHMSVAYQTLETSTAPSIRPIRILREDVQTAAGTLIVHLGQVGDPALHLRTQHGVVQTIKPGVGRLGTYRFDLSRLADTMVREPQGELSLDPDGQIVVATIRPRRLFDAITLAEGTLTLEGAVDVPGLTALVYAARAPWRSPAELSVKDGCTALPEWLVEAGELRVLVRIDDPWASAAVPEWPAPGASVALPQAGHLAGTGDEEALSAFLAGEGEMPANLSNLDRLWTIRGLLKRLGLAGRASDVAVAVDAALAAQPRNALVSIANSRLPLEAIPRLMVGASLPWSDLSEVHEDEPPAWSHRSALPAMLLSAADGEWSEEEIVEASGVLGAAMIDLLNGTDPDASAGRLGASTDLYDAQPALRGELLRPLKLVPKALLDADSRTMAAIAFVDARHNERLEWLCRSSRHIARDGEGLLSILGDTRAAAAVHNRRHPTAEGGWRLLPAVSLANAFAARHAARGHEGARAWVVRQQRSWIDLAAVAPAMVTTDLIIAELLTANHYANRENPS